MRDNQFRKMSPVKTVEMWPSVLAGEKKWIEPFRGNADAEFDSYLSYELAALKPYAGGLLERARLEMGERREIVVQFRRIKPVEIASIVAYNLLVVVIREFSAVAHQFYQHSFKVIHGDLEPGNVHFRSADIKCSFGNEILFYAPVGN